MTMVEPRTCKACGDVYDEARGDGYCGLCPACADDYDAVADELDATVDEWARGRAEVLHTGKHETEAEMEET